MSIVFYYQSIYNWQEPNNTEKIAFENLFKYFIKNNIDDDVSYYAYPWANIIEYAQTEKTTLYEFVTNNIKTHLNSDKLSITTFQSYKIWNYIEDFKKFDMNVIFSPHAEKKKSEEVFLETGILILPMFLVSIITPEHNIHDNNNIYNLINNEYVSSFLGNINYGNKPCTYIRNKMCNVLKNMDNVLIKTTNEWHLDNKIYGKELRMKKYEKSKEEIQKENEDNYFFVMNASKYSLCPLGVGPNSFRISETIMFEKFPIIIADDLWLPKIQGLDVEDWGFKIPENKVDDLYEYKKIFNTSENELSIKKENIKKIKKYVNDVSYPIKEWISEKFVLLTVMYNVKNEERLLEFKHVFNRNIHNRLIDKIVIFYEVLENETPLIYDFLLHKKINIVVVKKSSPRTISFNEMMEYCNNNLQGKICIISNNDIYYDDSLEKIKKINLIKNKDILAITRNNFFEFKIKKNNTTWQKNEGSQDTWIFCSPIKLFTPIINIGWIASDNRIAYEFEKLGYNVYNPTHDINCVHYQHQDQNTNLTKFSHRGDGPIKFLELDYLENNTNHNFVFYEEIENETINASLFKNKLNYRAVRQFYNDKKLKEVINMNIVCYFSENYPSTTSESILCQKILYSVPNMKYFNTKEKKELKNYLSVVKNSLVIVDTLTDFLLNLNCPIVFLCDEKSLEKSNTNLFLLNELNIKTIFLSHSCLTMFDEIYKHAYENLNYEVLNIGSDLNVALKKSTNDSSDLTVLCDIQSKKIRKKIKGFNKNIIFQSVLKPSQNEHYYDYIHKKEKLFLNADVFCQFYEPNIHLVLDAILIGTPVIILDDKTFYGDIPNECLIKIPVDKLNAQYINSQIEFAIKNKYQLTKNAFGWYLSNSSFDKWNNKFKEILTTFYKKHNFSNNVSMIKC